MKYKRYQIWWSAFKTMCVLRPMYAQINETDLDNVYTEHVRKFRCGYIFYRAMIDFYNTIEYKGAFFSITKEQYEMRKPMQCIAKDYIAEAHENGNPYNVRG